MTSPPSARPAPPKQASTVRYKASLRKAIRKNAKDPEIVEVAQAMRSMAGGSVEATARAIHSYVKRVVRFAYEPVETFQSARYTLFYALVGDCDDHARAVMALCSA